MLQVIDDGIARVERVLLLVSLAMMTVLVGLDVVQRTFSRPLGRTEALVAAVIDLVAGPLTVTGRGHAETAGSVAFFVVFVLLFCFGAHTARSVTAQRRQQAAPGVGGSIGFGLAALASVSVFIKLVLVMFPSSIPGAQKFALGFMLWSGMLGASLATRQRRHIMLDPIIKKLEGADRRLFALISGLVSGLFCAGIASLGVLQIGGEIDEWRSGVGVGVYPSLPIPMWIATLAIPVTFAVMAARFWRNAAADFKHGPPNTVDAHSVDLEEVEKLAMANEAVSS